MRKDNNYMGYWNLFLATGNILFATISLYVKRTNKNITLDEKIDELSL